jgi:FtsP/CotA-like multicopper oxidase with cupredoxin domain
LSNITVDGKPRNAINGAVWPNIDVPMFMRNGDYQLVVENKDSGPHPFHIHGNRFQVIDVDGKGSVLTGWKDTFDVRSGSRVTLRGRLDNPGHWMVHCHIVHHMEEGMMTELMVH